MRFKPYPKYKPSGVKWLGDVPEHWEITRLKRTSDVRLSNVDKHTVEGQQEVKLCNYVDVYKNDRITSKIDFMKASASNEQIARLTLAKGDVIITKDSETPSDIGVPALVDEEILGLVCGYHLALVRPTSSLGNYLSYLFQSHFVRATFEVEATGMTRYALGKYSIENLVFAAPMVKEQSAIAAFLDCETAKIDTLIAKQEKLIELLKEKRQAIISHAVTKGLNPNVKMKDSGIEWLGEVPEHWDVCSVRRKLLEHRQGYYTTDEYVDSGARLLRITDLRSYGHLDYSEAPFVEYKQEITPFLLQKYDFVFARTGGVGLFGMVEEVGEAVAYASYLIRFRFDSSILPNFMRYYFLSSSFQNAVRQNIHGGVNQNVHAEDIKNQVIAIPPLSEQSAISVFLAIHTSKIDTLIAKAEQAIVLQQEHRTALISAAVTGRVDVRNA